jgi:CheY-like chemotaxis protein
MPRIVVFDESPASRAQLCRYLEAQGLSAAGVGGLTEFSQAVAGDLVNLIVFCAQSCPRTAARR